MSETCKLPTASLRPLNRHPSFHSQSQRTPRDDAKLAVSMIRQNPTKSDKILRKLVCARTRARQQRSVPVPSTWICTQVTADSTYPTTVIPARSRHSRNPPTVIPTHTHVIPTIHHRHSRILSTSFPRRRESIPPKQIRHTVWSRRPLTLMPINRTELFPILCC